MAGMVGILHRDAIRRLVDDRTFERGQAYVAQGRVADLVREERQLAAVVKGSEDYRVAIRTRGDSLAYSCTCPVGAEGGFCKHAVAVALTWVAEVAPDAVPPAPAPLPEPPPKAEIDALAARLRAQERDQLLRILLDEAATDVALCRRIARRLPTT